jgi:hypothetical protein
MLLLADSQPHRSLVIEFQVQVFPHKFLGMAAKRKRTMKDENMAHELFLDSNSDDDNTVD